MKVLSVRQPWAWAIIHGGKDVENRNWYTSFRGTLAIHAERFRHSLEKLFHHKFSSSIFAQTVRTTQAKNTAPMLVIGPYRPYAMQSHKARPVTAKKPTKSKKQAQSVRFSFVGVILMPTPTRQGIFER